MGGVLGVRLYRRGIDQTVAQAMRHVGCTRLSAAAPRSATARGSRSEQASACHEPSTMATYSRMRTLCRELSQARHT